MTETNKRASVTMCCECGKVRIGRVWMESGPLANSSACVSHGFCPHCYDAAMLAAAMVKVASFSSVRV